MLQEISQACHYLLLNYPGAESVRSYLDSRLQKDTQSLFQFGYFPSMEEIHLLTDLVGQECLLKNKLIWPRSIEDSLGPRTLNFSHFEHYPLVMPFHDPYGKIVGLVGRTLLSSEEMKKKGLPKYKNTQFRKSKVLFGLWHNKREIIEQNLAYIVEGQFDVMKAVERGIKNVVGIGGASMTTYQFCVISRYANNLIMLLDNDHAGVQGRKTTLAKYGNFANIQNFYLPEDYKDIDEYLTSCPEASPSFIVRGV
jgi:DNA primase catalytic core